jgi:hypothetical protein
MVQGSCQCVLVTGTKGRVSYCNVKRRLQILKKFKAADSELIFTINFVLF